MKKLYVVLIAFLVFGGVEAQVINFPDANFKAQLLMANSSNQIAKNLSGNYITIDSNFDGEIQVSEALQVSSLTINSFIVNSLIGINSFSNLKFFDFSFSQVTSLDVSNLTILEGLFCANNQINNLNVSGLTNLKYLDCNNNQLTTLNIDTLTSLQSLTCYSNQLPSLNVSGLTNLSFLECSHNQLTSLNVSGLTNLQGLYCNDNQLPSINVSGLTSLKYLDCNNNQLTSLNVTGLTNLLYVGCYNNQLPSLDVSGLINLTAINCSNNQLNTLFIKNGTIESTLEFSGNPNLEFVCADLGQISDVQTKIVQYGYTNCTVSSTCSLSNPTFAFSDYFTLSPVPAKYVLNITAKQESAISSISIYNTLGQLMLVTSNPSTTLDVSDLAPGSYFVKVLSDKGSSSGKFMKE